MTQTPRTASGQPAYIEITTDAGTFDAIAAGPEDGRPVLLLHGFPEAAVEWEHQVAVLGANGFRAVAPDQRGYSPRARPERAGDYGIDTLADDVVAMADALGVGRFDVVGHDWGGAVAWRVADRHVDRVRSLSAISTPHPAALASAWKSDEDQQQRSRYMIEWRSAGPTEKAMLADNAKALRGFFDRRVPASRVDDYVERFTEPGALTAALNWYRASGPGERLGKVSVPTLYVWSTEDVAFGSTAALGTAEWVSGPYRFEMLEDVSHWIPEEVPEQLSSLLLEHLAGT